MPLPFHIPFIVQRQLLDASSLHPIRHCAGGLSGAGVIECQSAVGERFALRRWPTVHPTPDRLRQIHAAMMLASEKVGLVPRLISTAALSTNSCETFICDGEHLWELATWVPGKADYLENPSPSRLQAAVEAVAKVHDCWCTSKDARLGACVGPSQAMKERQQRLEWWLSQEGLKQRIAAGLQALPASRRERYSFLAVRSVDMLFALGAEILHTVQLQVSEPVLQHFVMRDLWSEHVLFDGDAVSGLIDFGAARIDEPAVDLARLLGSLEPASEIARAKAVDWYCTARRLVWPPQECESFWQRVKTLDRASSVLSALQWLEWTVLQPRVFRATEDFIANRWNAFLTRLH